MFDRTRIATIAVLCTALLAACSDEAIRLPTAPGSLPLATMTAYVNGVPWRSSFAGASPSEDGNSFIVVGVDDTLAIGLAVPGGLPPKGATYTLDAGPGAGLVLRVVTLTAFRTGATHNGAVTFTASDSIRVAGVFQFAATDSTQSITVTRGAFNVPVDWSAPQPLTSWSALTMRLRASLP